MLHKQTFEFLKWLEDFNDKKFFDLYKSLYLKIKKDFDNLVYFLIKEISKFDDSISWLEVKKCTFRIYKDMRFPRNREHPYKNNLWANISIWWKNSGFAWYYIHIQDNESFFSWWLYNTDSKKANLIRNKIYNNRNKFKKVTRNKDFIKVFWDIFSYNTELKKLPKGFDPMHPSTKYLKNKSRLTQKKISNKDALSENLWKQILEYSKITKKLNDFLNNLE